MKPVVRTPLGEASLPPHVAEPVLEALAGGPRSIGELGTLPGVEKTTPGELVAVLVGGGWCLPLWRDPPPAESAAAAAARRFNLVALNRYGLEQRRGGVSAGIVAPAAGAAYPCQADELAAAVMIQDAARTGEPEPDIETLLGRLLTSDAPAEVVSALRERLSGRIPGWRMLGLI